MSSINIPDVVKILRLHGLIPVPVDIDIDTLKTTPERIEEAITPRTCMIIISYVYAAKYSIQDIAAVAKKHSLPIYEDAAEAFVGLSYTGDPNANVTSFSFGPIKTCTGFGGCVSIVRDSMETLSKMKQIHATYPVQKTSVYLKKLLKSAVGKLVLNNRTMNYSIRPVLMAMKINYKKAVVKLMRGFPPEQSGLEKYRIQPCTAMLSFIYKRLACFNEPQFWKETENLIVSHMQAAQRQLVSQGITVPGHNNKERAFWLFPIVADKTWEVYKKLDDRGIDVFKGVTQLNVVPAPVGASYKQPTNGEELMNKVIYLPIHRDMPFKHIKQICEDVSSVINRSKL